MYNVSALFETGIKSKDRIFEGRVLIDDVEYFTGDIIDFIVEDSLTPDNKFTLGSIVSSKLMAKIRTSNEINDNSVIKPQIRLMVDDVSTEWLPFGSFKVKSKLISDYVYSLTCYDEIYQMDIIYESNLSFPASMIEVVNEICLRHGIEFDSSFSLNPTYVIDNLDKKYTERQVLGYIAGCHGCNCKISKENKLKFIQVSNTSLDNAIETIPPSAIYTQFKQINDIKTITKIIVTDQTRGNVQNVQVGVGESDDTLTFDNPYMTQTMLDNIYLAMNGFTYIPYEHLNWKCYPQIEVGDAVNIAKVNNVTLEKANIAWQDADFPWNGIESVATLVLNSSVSFKGGLKGKINAPIISTEEVEYDGSLTSKVNNAVTELNIMNGKIQSKVSKDNVVSEINQSAEEIKISAEKVGLEGYVTFTNLETGGEVVIDGGNLQAGTVNTDKVELKSENGKLSILADLITMNHIDGSKSILGPNNLKFEHDAGNYSLFDATGFKRYVNGELYPYTFRNLVGTGVIPGSQSHYGLGNSYPSRPFNNAEITLPDDFKGKNFTVVAFANVINGHSSYPHYSQYKVKLVIENINKTEGTFEVHGYAIFSYYGSMGYDYCGTPPGFVYIAQY